MEHKLKNQNKLIKIILLIAIIVIAFAILVSCSGSKDAKKYIVNITVEKNDMLLEVDSYISAINGIPSKTNDTSGKFEEKTNIEVTVNIKNPKDFMNYNILFKNGNKDLTQIQYPCNKFIIEGLDKDYNLIIEVTAIAKDDDSNNPSNPELDPGISETKLYSYQILHKCGDLSLPNDFRNKEKSGINISIVADNYEGTDNIYKYRFKEWGLIQAGENNKDIIHEENKYNPILSINIKEDDNTNDIIIVAYYDELIETHYSKNVKIQSGYNKNGIEILNVDVYKKNPSERYPYYRGYFAEGDTINLSYVNSKIDNKYNRFNGWYRKDGQGKTLVSKYIDYSMKVSKDIENNYLVDVIEQTLVISNLVGEFKIDKGDNILINNIPNDKVIKNANLNGVTAQYEEKSINNKYVLDFGVTTDDVVNIQCELAPAYTLYKYGFDGIGSFEIEKVNLQNGGTRSLIVNSSDVVTAIKVNGKVKTNADNYTLNEDDVSWAQNNNDSLLKVEACYTPYYTNYDGKITDQEIVDDIKMNNSFDNAMISKEKVSYGFYLPGLNEKQSIVVEGIEIDSVTKNYILAGYVETNFRNDELVTNPRNDVLFVMKDTTVSTENNSNILSSILLQNEDGSPFVRKISSITILYDKLLLSTYENNQIYYVDLNAIRLCGQTSYLTVYEFLQVSFDYITTLETYNNHLFVGGKLVNDTSSESLIKYKNGDSFIGEYIVKENLTNDEYLLYHSSGVSNEQYNSLGFVPNVVYRMANKATFSAEYIIDGLAIDYNGNFITVFGPDETVALRNNDRSEVCVFNTVNKDKLDTEYLGNSIKYIDCVMETKKATFMLPPLIKDVCVDNSIIGSASFISVGSSYIKHILPSDMAQCQKPISKLLKVKTQIIQELI